MKPYSVTIQRTATEEHVPEVQFGFRYFTKLNLVFFYILRSFFISSTSKREIPNPVS